MTKADANRPAASRAAAGNITWQSIQAEALRRIHDREWAPGSLIPHEEELAAEFGCARATVNRALRELAILGMLERRRKAGTRVPLNPVRRATFQIPVIRQDVEAKGMDYAYQRLTLGTKPLPAAIAAALSLESGTPCLHVTSLHMADGKPYCQEDRWINPAVEGAGVQDFVTISPNEWLVQNIPFSRGGIDFSATSASPILADMLQCKPGEALFVMERTTFSGDMPVTAVRLTYAPGHKVSTAI